ncbi:MAG: type IV pilus twitching motility protein PilT [Verrucomicrobiales bacterium]
MAHALVDRLIETALVHGASDLFLSEGLSPRLKIHGKVAELSEPAISSPDLVSFWQKCGHDPSRERETDTSYYLEKFETRLRVSLFHHCGRLGAVLRPIKSQVPNFETLGLPEAVLVPWLQRRSGLILISGATGSGKSTSIASCLEWLNSHFQRHIVTIEDPIEYLFVSRHCLFTQREVGIDTESFPRGLRGALRQAPDVIFVGEIRDSATAVITLQAAETGHLVLATLHSADAVDSFDRLNHLFPESERAGCLMLLARQLVGIMSQLLLPRADEKGVFLVTEHLENSGAVKPWIRQEKLPEIRDYLNREHGQSARSFTHSLLEATRAGIISADVAQQASASPSDFVRALRGLS